MKPGLVSITLRSFSVGRLLRLAVSARLEGIEWGGDVHVPHGDLETARRVGRQTREAGLAVASYGSYFRFAACDPEAGASDPGPSRNAVLDTAEALGAPAVRVWAGRRGPTDTPTGVRAAIVEEARAFADDAARRGLRLEFEYHDHTLTETPASTCALLDAIGRHNVRTLWQPPLQTSPAERLRGLDQVAPLVSNVHCNHFGQNPWPGILPLREGGAEWRGYLARLRQADTSRWVLLEHVRDEDPDRLRKDADTLHRWLSDDFGG